MVTLLLCALLCTVTSAQVPTESGQVETVTVSGAPPALFAVGVSGGFPSYQTVALSVSLQSSFVGLQLKGSWTPAGPYLGVQLRGYPPLEAPVPLFVGVGAGIYGGNASYHAAVGTHVPLSLALRLDLEAGVASVPLLDSRGWAPHVVAGLSYAFPVDLTAAAGGGADAAASSSRSGGSQSSGCAASGPPDETALSAAFERTLAEWLAGARATYGSVYTDLSYSYRVTSQSVSGDAGVVHISYSGSVTAIGSGTVHEADGSASASFRWTGCGWSNTGVSY